MNDTLDSVQDIRSSEYGLELFKGDKYDWSFKEDTYTLVVKSPTTVEEGTYQIVVKELDMKASGYLTVKGKQYVERTY